MGTMAHNDIAWRWPKRPPNRGFAADDLNNHDTQVIVIGGGGAGLSAGACLRAEGVDHIVLDRLPEAGDVWRRRYNRLHLHHPSNQMYLPFMPLPPNIGEWASKDELADYFNSYAKLMHVNFRGGLEVLSVLPAVNMGPSSHR